MKSEELKAWARQELGGYELAEDVPGYRWLSLPVLGNFSDSFGGRYTGCVIPTLNIPESLARLAGPVEIYQGVRELEGMAEHRGDEPLRVGWIPEAVAVLRGHVSMSGGAVLTEVYRPILPLNVHGVLDAIRNRLLDFVLGLGTRPAVPS